MPLRSRQKARLEMVVSDKDLEFYPGTWSLNQEIEGAKNTFFVTLNPDSTVSLPPDVGPDNTDSKIRWTVKHKDFVLAVPKRSTLSTIFDDREYVGTPAMEDNTIRGTIMDGESDPEFVGRFSMSKIAAYSPGSGASSSLEWDGREDEEVWFDEE
ncbi:hypothetical protein GUITHDRAFT_99266 [Guillardia theta CCMP2712]|uniref:Uncharacterized protein n=2 Tax=Guillardia theta TaxID=55529 RepID=L1K3U7_GUITC|nr:hypothetical protein GUITHDRAFT_99266 [Guillardia theta CCMP2712]EKX55491.1 hypothetical protein GUITHDRAFT_99266 [Guillardia theta CCMP2712]|eukprot:XP_005842471.1 hypothetical protein GUITHDRAFT_99266 [Guillardia theta CCMP2712]